MLLRPTVLVLVAVGLALSLAPGAAAQASVTLTLAGLEDGMTVGLGQTHPMSFDVTLTAQGFACTAASSFPVALSVDQTAPDYGFNATVTPEVLNFAVNSGAYLQSSDGVPIQPYSKTEKATLNIELGNNVPAGHGDHTFKVLAAWDGTPPKDCQAQTWPSDGASASADHRVTPEYPAGDDLTGTGTGTGTNKTDGGGSDNEESPVAPAVLTLGTVLFVAAALRRRQ